MMKKKYYSKPQILIEDFSLITNIAGNCEKIVGNPSKDICAVKATGEINIFNSNVDECVFNPTTIGQPNDDAWDGFCYHVPVEYQNLFNS